MTAESGPPFSAGVAEIIHAALKHIECNVAESIHVEELASAARVECRTLLRAFKRCFQVTPKRYIRQLNLVRDVLCAPEASSAVDIMADFGATEFGRFATEYKRVFDEPPSETMRRTRLKALQAVM
jgi:transcriptional regulator GlxA family with amidase domain